MPRYSCIEVLREKLKYAIHFCKSIDTDDYARIALTGDQLEESSDESQTHDAENDLDTCITESEGEIEDEAEQ